MVTRLHPGNTRRLALGSALPVVLLASINR